MNNPLNLSDIKQVAEGLANIVQPGDVVLFQGDLGAGKSTFIRKMIQTLIGPEVDVPSPTFTLVQTYEGVRATYWHFDLYRLHDPDEVYELGIEEAFHDGISFIEWPDRLGYLTPKEYLLIDITHGESPDERYVTFKPTPAWAERIKGLA